MKHLILLVLICFLFQSCISDCTDVYFTENDKTWFEQYEAGDQLIFKSQFHDYDTIHITNKIVDHPKGECKLFVSNYDKDFVRVDYEFKKDTFKIEKDYFIQINANENLEDASPIIRLLNLECGDFHHNLPDVKPSKTNPLWKEVYTFDQDDCPYNSVNGRFKLTAFQWDRKYGLVTYTDVKGERWSLIKKERTLSDTKAESSFDNSKFELQPGDILFQDSDCGPFCESIEKVTFGYKGSKFSHVGMVIENNEGEQVVIEAITKGVVETPLEDFFKRSYDKDNNSKVVVGRIKKDYAHLIPEAIQFAQTKKGLAYDDVFDISNNKYYCSELLYESFKFANDNEPVFELQKMTYKDPDTDKIFPIWEDYFQNLNAPVPEGEPGLNPGGMSTSNYLDIVHFYGRPEGYTEKTLN